MELTQQKQVYYTQISILNLVQTLTLTRIEKQKCLMYIKLNSCSTCLTVRLLKGNAYLIWVFFVKAM